MRYNISQDILELKQNFECEFSKPKVYQKRSINFCAKLRESHRRLWLMCLIPLISVRSFACFDYRWGERCVRGKKRKFDVKTKTSPETSQRGSCVDGYDGYAGISWSRGCAWEKHPSIWTPNIIMPFYYLWETEAAEQTLLRRHCWDYLFYILW